MSPVDLLLAVFAGLMALTTAALLRWAAEARTHLSRAVVVFLLVMMGAMFAGSLVYFLTPGRTSLVEGLWLSAGIMSVSVFPLLSAFLDEAQRRVDPSGPQPLEREGRPGLFLSAVIGLVLASEFLMGWTFLLASGSGPIRGGAAGVLVSVIDSPWFLFTMAAEMAATAYLLRDRLASSARTALALQAAVMALSPPALRWSPWITASIVAGSAVMIGFILFVLEFVYRNPQIDRPFSHYLLAVLGAYAVMMAGLFVWVWQGSADLFAGSILLEMGVYFAFAIRPSVYGR
ncbi:MAG TPA: hypothetical protein VGS23_01230, partial [Thermoplasmata archaeon]|nr:hypothetical protein [Thermoplasmata archaeon]